MWRTYLDVFFVMLVDVVSLVLVEIHVDIPVVRIAIGFLLVFILPGYLLSLALFPESRWPLLERVVLMIGLSLVISMAGGLILHAFSIHLQEKSWTLYFGLVTMILGCMAAFRRFRLSQIPNRRKTDTRLIAEVITVPTVGQLLLLGLSIAITLEAVVLAQNIAVSHPGTEIVQLWILPGDQNSDPNVRLGVLVNESAPNEFSLWLERDGYTIQEWPRLVLKPNEKWEVTIPIDPNMSGTGRIDAYLYLYNQPNIPYRHVILGLDQLENNE